MHSKEKKNCKTLTTGREVGLELYTIRAVVGQAFTSAHTVVTTAEHDASSTSTELSEPVACGGSEVKWNSLLIITVRCRERLRQLIVRERENEVQPVQVGFIGKSILGDFNYRVMSDLWTVGGGDGGYRLKSREYQGEKVEILLQRNWDDEDQEEDGGERPQGGEGEKEPLAVRGYGA